MQALPETPFQMPLYWLIKWYVYKRLVLPWQQISNLTRGNSANENAWSSVSWLRSHLTWRSMVKQKLEFNLLPSCRLVSWQQCLLNLEKRALIVNRFVSIINCKTQCSSEMNLFILSFAPHSLISYTAACLRSCWMTAFVQTFKYSFQDFPGSCKDQIPGFFRTQKNPFSRTFQETSHWKHWLHEVNWRLVFVNTSFKEYLTNTIYNGISNNRFDPRGGTVLKSIAYAYLLSDYSKQK